MTGLPATTLRYYEDIGLIPPVARNESSGHRVYQDEDVERLTWVACLTASGMSISDLRNYLANLGSHEVMATDQIALLTRQLDRLRTEADVLHLRQEYVADKIAYWQAVADGNSPRAAELAVRARELARAITQTPKAQPEPSQPPTLVP